MSRLGRQCCSPYGRPPETEGPCRGVDTALPDPLRWLADSTFGQVRAGLKELKKNAKDSGPRGPVEHLQQALRHWGCNRKRPPALLLPKYGADGDFGNETEAAVLAFQKENKDKYGNPLVPDGIVGDLTMSALDVLVAPPKKLLPTDVIMSVTVDVVIFPDGHSSARLPRILHEANYVFGKAGIRFKLGTVWEPSTTGAKACQIFEVNRGQPHTRDRRTCPSTVQRQSVEWVTPEAQRLAAFRPGGNSRITVYHVGPFPPGSVTPWGATFTPRATNLAFSVLIPTSNTADPVDIWWHELGHCLLNTGPHDLVDGKADDHRHPFMGIQPFPGLGKASLPIAAAVVKHMRDTVFLDLS